jgi:hypothetical protein
MAEPLRHRQTKEAATDMFYLTPPRHISTLPKGEILAPSRCFPLFPRKQTSGQAEGVPLHLSNASVRHIQRDWPGAALGERLKCAIGTSD